MDSSSKLVLLARLGCVARGILYVTIALLVITAGREEDLPGALVYLGKGVGRWLLAVIAAGFAGYGLWRLADGLFNIEHHGRDRHGIGQRFGALGSGLAHLFLAWQTAWLLTQSLAGAGVGDSAREGARTALHVPGGALALAAAGAILLGVGAVQLVTAVTCRFCEGLDPAIADHPLVRWIGRLGYAARGVVFLISGFFVGKAGIAARASEAGGMEQALSWLAEPWDVAVAAGLLLFGVYCFIEARYRRIHQLPVARVVDKVEDTLAIG